MQGCWAQRRTLAWGAPRENKRRFSLTVNLALKLKKANCWSEEFFVSCGVPPTAPVTFCSLDPLREQPTSAIAYWRWITHHRFLCTRCCEKHTWGRAWCKLSTFRSDGRHHFFNRQFAPWKASDFSHKAKNSEFCQENELKDRPRRSASADLLRPIAAIWNALCVTMHSQGAFPLRFHSLAPWQEYAK